MTSSFGQLQAQVASLNAQLAQMVNTNKSVDPRGYERLAKAAELNSKTFRNAAASTGMFEVQQVRLNSATDEYVKKLKAQKTSFRELIRTRKIAAAAYKEQLAMEQGMQVRRNPASNLHGREVFDVTYPRAYTKEIDTAGNRLSWFNEQLKSGSTQMVNWGKNTQWAGRQLMVGFTMPILAVGAAAGVMAYQVDKELTRVRKVYDTVADSNSNNLKDQMAVEKELDMVRQEGLKTAIFAAREYGQSGKDTLGVQAELAASGKQGAELQKATAEVMRISRLGEIDYQTTTEATIALQQIFKMSTQELTESFNYMNSIENATSLQTKDFAAAIPVAGAAVKAWGGDIKELGLLLTMMKEEGIGASEGANALKATMQRLARPSKQIREEFQMLTGVNISNITDNAGSLTEVFQGISEATKGLDAKDQRKAFAGLFGSYQVTKMMALTKGMEDLNDETSQVSAAFRIGQQDSSEWASTAEREIQRYRESVSGQFDSALQEMKLQLATLGEPFVEAATEVLKVVSMMIAAFNNMPDFSKKFIAISVVLAAIAGPVVMLTGLFGNLIGNGVKMFAGMLGAVARLGGGMQILDKENRIAAASAKMMEAGYISQTKAVQNLTAALAPLAAAQRAANTASANMVGPAAVTRLSPAAKRQADEASRLAHMQRAKDTLLMQGASGKTYYGNEQGMKMSNKAVDTHAMGLLQSEAKAMNKEMSKGAVAAQRVRMNMTGAAAGSIAMAASMGLMMGTSNETANNVGKMLMIATVVAPGAIALVSALKAGAIYMKAIEFSAMRAAVANKMSAGAGKISAVYGAANAVSLAASAKGTHSAASASAKMLGSMKGVWAVMRMIMGPVGWIASALGAAGFLLYKNYKSTLEEQKELIEGQQRLLSSTEEWADAVGHAKRDMQAYSELAISGESEKTVSEFDRNRDFYTGTDSGKQQVKDFKNLEGADQENMAMLMLIETQQKYKISAEEAALRVAALWSEANDTDAEEAVLKMREMAEALGDVVGTGSNSNFSSMWDGIKQAQEDAMGTDQFESWFDGWKEEKTKVIKYAADRGTQAGEAFGHAWRASNSESEYEDQFKQIADIATAEWSNVFDDMSKQPDVVKAFNKLGITSGQELAAAWNTPGIKSALTEALTPAEMRDLEGMAGDAALYETAIIKAAGAAAGLSTEVKNVVELQREAVVAAGMMNDLEKKNSISDALSVVDSTVTESYKEVSKAAALTAINAVRMAEGLAPMSDYAKATAWAMEYVNGATAEAAEESTRFKTGLRGARGEAQSLVNVLRGLNAIDLSGALKDAMGSVQSSIADDYTEAFNASQDAAMERTRSVWDSRVEGVQADIERQQTGLDNKWEKRKDGAEKYWDGRVEAVERAIEAEEKAEEKRQEMFEAEIARIQRLADMANTNIDFNVALQKGNLDEAAKIRNDANAAADQFGMQSVNDQLSKRSDKRLDKLGKKKDDIESQRDAAMDAMSKREDAEKAHLDKVSDMRQKAAEADRDAAIKAKEQELAIEKDKMEKAMEIMTTGTSASEKELRRRFDKAGLDYDFFYNKVIKPKGQEWGSYFSEKLAENMRLTAQELASDKMWAQMGEGSMNEMAKAMGFSSKQSMMHFLETGEIKDFAETPMKQGKTRPEDTNFGPVTTSHGGGWAGQENGRDGVAKNYKGLHPSETLVRAQKGEYIVNKDAASSNAGLLQDINDGKKPIGDNIMGGGTGPAPMMAAAIMRNIASKVSQKIGAAVSNKQSVLAGSTGYSSGAGNYALAGVKPWVAEAAAYLGSKFGIASIGGVGERSTNPTSDHPMGLALDFMTNDVDKGNALAAEALRLQNVLDATYMIWQGKIHSFDDRGWQTYSHPSGATDPTSMHMDHVHISFAGSGKVGDLPGSIPGGSGTMVDGFQIGSGSSTHPTGGVGSTGSSVHGSPPAIDISLPVGNKVMAVRSGRITGSYDIPGYEPRAEHGGLGYKSYGRVITMAHDAGGSSLYAHLSQRFAQVGQHVPGGSVLGLSGNTGYSTGPHLHFGGTPAPSLYLKKGAANINFDNTPAMLHKNEAVLTEDLNRKFHEGVNNFANGPSNKYTVIVNPSEGMDEEMLADKVVRKLKAAERRKPQSRTAKN